MSHESIGNFSRSETGKGRVAFFLAVLIAVSVISFFPFLGTLKISSIKGGRVAEVAREMVETHEYLLPRLNGELRLQKPPLSYWITALSYKAFGRVDEFTARFPTALLSIVAVIAMYFFARTLFNRRAGFIAGLALISTNIFLYYARSCRIDATLLLFLLCSNIFLYLAWQREKKKFVLYIVAYGFMGLAFLTKGPAGIAFPLAGFLAVIIARKDWRELKNFFIILPAGLVAFSLVCGWWYLFVVLKHPEAMGVFSIEMDVTLGGKDHPDVLLYYFYELFYLFLPSYFLSIPIFYRGIKKFRSSDGLAYCLISFFVGFLILTFTGNKQTQYALIILWPFAALAGWFLDAFLTEYSSSRFMRLSTSISFYVLSIAVGAGVLVCYIIFSWSGSLPNKPPLVFVAIFLLTVLASIISFGRKKYAAALSLVFLWSVIAFVPGKIFIKKHDFEDRSTYTFCAELKNLVPENAPLYRYGSPTLLLTFQMKRILPKLSSPDELLAALSGNRAIYVVYENRDIADPSPVKEEVLFRKKLFEEKTLTLSRFSMTNKR